MIECILRDSTTIRTVGLQNETGFELQVDAVNPYLIGSAEMLLLESIQYQLASGRAIRPGETVEWGCGLLRFQLLEREPHVLEAFEKRFDDGAFQKGAMSTLALWQRQRDVCENHKTAFDPPRPAAYCVASPDLLNDGARGGIEGVRYPYTAQNSGWWLFGPTFDGVIERMMRVELAAVLSKLGLARGLLALPPGFAFCTDQDEERIWFEQEASMRLPI